MNIKKFLVILIIVAGSWYVLYGQKTMPMPENRSEAYLKTVKKVKSQEVLQLIESKQGMRLVHIYSSTCILCRFYFGDIIDTARNYPGISVIAVATDRHPILLASFLLGKNLPFTPLLLDDSPESLARALKTVNINYEENEPYTAVIDRSGQVMEFSVGDRFAARIANYLEERK